MSMRFPRRPERNTFTGDELAAFDRCVARETRPGLGRRHPKGAGGYSGLLVSPLLAGALVDCGTAVTTHEGTEGHFSFADHQWAYFVLSFDAGHWGLVANHIPTAIAAGISAEAIQALRCHHEERLNPDEQFQTDFVRRVAAGSMTDEIWTAAAHRQGSERGAVELAFMILLMLFHIRLMQTFDEQQISSSELDELLHEIRDGTWEMPDVELMKATTPNPA